MKEKWIKGLKLVFALGLCVGLLWVSIALAAPGDIELISDSDFDSYGASISGDGRYVAFETMLPPYNPQIYVFDRELGIETHIDEGGTISYYEYPEISADGQWLAYRKSPTGGGSRIHLLKWQETYTPDHVIEPPVSVPGWYGLEDISISEDGCRVGYSFEYEVSEDVYIEDVYYYDCIAETSFLVSKAFGSDNRGNGGSGYASISDNGLVFGFSSFATNLVDTNPPIDGRSRVYLRDLVTGVTKRIMLPPEWEAKDEIDTQDISLSADGCHVAFGYRYEVAGEQKYEIFLYNCNTEETILISTFNSLPSGYSYYPSISGDGRFVTFSMYDGVNDQVYFYDSETGEIKLVSKGLDGNPGNGTSSISDISANGRFIAFESVATNLVPDDENDAMDVFVYHNEISYALTVAVAPENAGLVTFDPAGGVYPEGTAVTLTPDPVEGFVFDSWSGEDAGDLVDNLDGTWSITMVTDKSVTANFVEDIIDTTTYIFLPLIVR